MFSFDQCIVREEAKNLILVCDEANVHARGDGHMFVRGQPILMHDTGDAVDDG